MGKTLILPLVPHLLYVKDNKVLLFERTGTGIMDGFYCSPTGSIEPNETPSEAIIRESFEEVGLIIESVKLVATVFFSGPNIRDHNIIYQDICLSFAPVGTIKGEAYNKEPHKHSNLGWFDIDKELPKKIIPTVRKAIELYKAGIGYGELNEISAEKLYA